MQNEATWEATKFLPDSNGGWKSNPSAVPVTSRLITNRVARAYSAMIEKYAKGRLVDIGCGAAPLYEMYRPYIRDVTCVDWETSRHSSSYVDKFVDLNTPFDLGESEYDTILATDVIEHLREPRLFISSCARALRPNGSLLIGAPFMYWIHEAPHDYHRYTRYGLEYMIEEAGLQCLSLEAYGGAPEVLSDILTKGLGVWRPLAAISYHVTNWLLTTPPVKRMSDKSKEAMPLGYTLVAQKPGEAPPPVPDHKADDRETL